MLECARKYEKDTMKALEVLSSKADRVDLQLLGNAEKYPDDQDFNTMNVNIKELSTLPTFEIDESHRDKENPMRFIRFLRDLYQHISLKRYHPTAAMVLLKARLSG